MKLASRWFAVLLAAGGLMGCGDPGERPLVIEGSIVGNGSLGEMQVGLLWTTETGGCLDARSRAGVQGGSPASFRLVVTEPPPAEAEFVSTVASQPPVARAYIVAFDRERRARGYATDAGSVVYGVFYASGEVPGNDERTGLYGGTALRAGYQMGLFDRSAGEPVLRLAGAGETVHIGAFAGSEARSNSVCSSR